MSQSITLQNIINEMDTWKDVANLEEQYKVRQIDAAIRKFRRHTVFPWNIKKTTLRVFSDVLVYPTASDHDELLYLDDSTNSHKFFSEALNFKFTSLKQFYEAYDSYRNLLADIWESGTKMLGVNLKNLGIDSNLLDNAETLSNYSVEDDATAVVKDTVTFKEGNASMRVTIVESADTATIKNTITGTIADSNYKKKYHFKWIYLAAIPTSIELRLQTDDSNYLATSGITTQFSGAPFKANDWNLIAHDLDLATETGTFDEDDIGSEKIILTAAASGTYFVDASYLREWRLLDYWYYSNFSVITSGSTAADKKFFIATAGTYDVNDSLIGDDEWFDIIMYDALVRLVTDIENPNVLIQMRSERNQAWEEFDEKYPNEVPLITTGRVRFNNDPGQIL